MAVDNCVNCGGELVVAHVGWARVPLSKCQECELYHGPAIDTV